MVPGNMARGAMDFGANIISDVGPLGVGDSWPSGGQPL